MRALEASGGDAATETPAFEAGDTFTILQAHANGWLEVAEGYLWPTWVEVQGATLGEELDALPRDVASPLQAVSPGPASSSQSPVVFTLTLSKVDGSFGMQIAGGLRKRLGVYIKRLRKNGAAMRDGRLEKYDEVIRVDDRDFTECTHEEAVAFLAVGLGLGPAGSMGKGCRVRDVPRPRRAAS